MANAWRWLAVTLLVGLALVAQTTRSVRLTVNMSVELHKYLQLSNDGTWKGTQRQATSLSSRKPESIPSPVEKLISGTKSAGKPRLYRTSCPNGDYRGLVVYFHGFSASPSQINVVYSKLLEACMDVFVPMLPGHGEEMIHGCTESGRCTVTIEGDKGFDLRELPTHGSEYKAFAIGMGALAEAELQFRIKYLHTVSHGQATLMFLGLSLGSSLAYAASREPRVNPSRMMLLNPFFGSGMEEVDLAQLDCMHDMQHDANKTEADCAKVVREKWLELYGAGDDGVSGKMSKKMLFKGETPGEVQAAVMEDLRLFSTWMPDLLMSKVSMMSAPVLWPANCAQIEEQGKNGEPGGFCAFQQKHVLAAHAFGMDTLEADVPDSVISTIQIMTTARDGITRNGLTYSLAARLLSKAPDGKGVAMCMHPWSEGTNPHDNGQYWSDEHSMPHANMGNADGWWEPELSERIVSFFSGALDTGKAVDEEVLIQQAEHGGDKTACLDLPLTKKPMRHLREWVCPEADPRFSSFARSLPDPVAKQIHDSILHARLVTPPVTPRQSTEAEDMKLGEVPNTEPVMALSNTVS